MALNDRLDRLERRLADLVPEEAPALSPERWEALMRKLQAVGLAEWRADWGQWHPTDPSLLRRLLRERTGMQLPHASEVTPW